MVGRDLGWVELRVLIGWDTVITGSGGVGDDGGLREVIFFGKEPRRIDVGC